MANKFIDQNGLRYFFSKLKRMFEGKADKDSLKPVATSGSYNDLEDKPTSLPANGGNADTVDNKHASDFATASHTHSDYLQKSGGTMTGDLTLKGSPSSDNMAANKKYVDDSAHIINKQGNTSTETWYFPLGSMVIDNSGNYGNFTFTGRIGGWTKDNSATYSIMLMNRGSYDGNTITSTVSASGKVSEALAICDIVVSKNSDLSHTVYLKCHGYYLYNFNWTAYQHSVTYNGTYTTTEPSNIIWKLSSAAKIVLGADGSFSASGGFSGLATVATSGSYNDLTNKPTVVVGDKTYKIEVSSTPPTVDDTSVITFVV